MNLVYFIIFYFIGGNGLLLSTLTGCTYHPLSFSCLISQVEEHRLISVPYQSVQVFIYISMWFLIIHL